MGHVTTLQHVELGVLGPLQVRQYGLPVAVPGAKPRALLTMLGLHGGSVVSADTLAELLWGASPPRTAAKALQTHISSLRRTLGDGYVLTEGTGWTLSTSEIDAIRYKLAARLGRDAISAGDAGQAVARFDEALALWRGIPELPDGPRGGSEKTRWIEGHAALVEDRADSLLATGRAAEIIGELEAAIADAPLRERRWGQLMLALYRAGRQGEALGAYQRARSLLAHELGVDPGPDLRRLETAIVAQDAALEVAVAEQLSIVTRAVTFLLTDIEGSTAAWEADSDAMAVALARHDEIVEQVVTSRGGRLVKTRGEGDATFSVFDRPSAAAAAAIELQEAIRHEPWALAEPMRIRVALHTGEVELRDGDYFGRAVNRAARLRSLAAGGQILCSGATAELVIDTLSDDVVLVDLGMRQLRNLSRPEHVFELRLETAEDSADPTIEVPPMQRPVLPTVLAGPGPFVGRGPELDGLLAAWQSTLAAGTRAMLIAGEPGVGKTRLAGEWSRQAYEQGAVVLYGRCDEDLGAAYQPFAEALRSLVPCVGAGRLRELRGAEALLPLVPGLTDVVPDLPMPSRSDPDTERYALFDAVVALLAVASASAPVVLILDDLHWAAKPTLLLLRHLLRFGEQARVQIVGTYRSTDLDRSHPLAAMLADLHRDGTASRITLGGLDEDDVTAYVAEAGYDDVELARALASVTGGNPFFLIEALRHVDESGGRWDPSTLPQGVREAVSRRLSRLPGETNKALAAAAVVGSRFPLALVESVVGDDLVDAFDEACKAGIVIEEPGGRYRFNHALVRQSLLAELASVRRMRLHQKIATTLEAESGGHDELLAELAYHYFECAWAGNAVKAVEYCRRAADQAIERLAYEGAADLYDRALHALEELDDELPDRDAQQAELLVARCEALLAAGDVGSAAGAVAQLQRAAGDSVRLAAWGICFDGQLSMLTDPERLDEIESEVSAAAQRLAELDDAAGEANAHTVRAACLARLGRIADCETALDQALTAARRARDHRRVNAVLAGAPLAALWGPNPVPRAGGRCLDVVRLLRITTGSPVVEATSTRCQGVLDAMRGRAAAGRQLIDSARRALTELGMRHALLEVDQFAGIVELVADDPASAEPHLRRAYDGFRRMGLDADTADTAALLARTCLALDRDAEADELCRESERLAGHALKPSIAWRAVRAQLLARDGEHDDARRVAEEAVAVAERTDELVDHGDACLALASVLGAAGDVAGARAAAEQAVALYERKGAAALVEKALRVLGSETATVASAPETPVAEPENECVRTLRRVEAAVNREAWSEVEQAHARIGSIESRRKIVGFERIDLPAGEMASGAEKFMREMRIGRSRRPIVAIRGERFALTRTEVGTVDDTPGAPMDEMFQLVGLDEEGRIALQIWFDVEDLDAAMAELDAAYARLEMAHPQAPIENECVRVVLLLDAAYDRDAWEEVEQYVAAVVSCESRRKIVGQSRVDNPHSEWVAEAKRYREVLAPVRYRHEVVAVRGERLALTSLSVGPTDQSPGAPRDELLQLYGLDEDGRIALQVWFDVEDIDAAFAELDSRYLAGEAAPHARTWSVVVRSCAAINRLELPPATPDWVNIDHRRGTPFTQSDMSKILSTSKTITPEFRCHIEAVHALSDVGAVVTSRSLGTSQGGFEAEWRVVLLQTVESDLLNRNEVFDEKDLDAALTRFDELGRSAAQLENDATRVSKHFDTLFNARDWPAITELYADDVSADDRRHVINGGSRSGRDAEIANLRAMAELTAPQMGSTVLAIRGKRLALFRTRVADDDVLVEGTFLSVLEINTDNRIVGVVGFDPDDLDAAFAELDARYITGEAAAHAHTWSVVAGSYAAVNRHELPAWTADKVDIDHRSTASLAPGELRAYLHAMWGQTPDVRVDIVAVHRLTSFGALVTHLATGTTEQGFEGEWREITLSTIDGDRISRSEMFDESDLEVALARFDELQRPAARLENTASRVEASCQEYIAAGDWDAMAAVLADDVSIDDRRRVVNAGLRRGRRAVMDDLRVGTEIGLTHITATPIAIRGERLTLRHIRYWGGDQRPEASVIELVQIVEIDSDDRISALVLFEVDEIAAAVAELDARYAEGEATDHARTWLVIAGSCAALNARQLPAPPSFVYVDRRRVANIGEGDMRAFFHAAWELTPDLLTSIESVHRLSGLGAVVSQVAQGTSENGFYAEWRVVNVYMVDGELLSRAEVFDEMDLDAAIARFDELNRPEPRLQTGASKLGERFRASFAARDWDAMAELLADDLHYEDRRRVVNAGIRHGRDSVLGDMRAAAEMGIPEFATTEIATRGERLVLVRAESCYDVRPGAFYVENLAIAEIDAAGRMTAQVMFDTDDVDAALQELDKRYVAGEAAQHADTWSAIGDGYAAFNRRDMPRTTPDWVNIDHRTGGSAFAPGDQTSYIHATWELARQVRSYATAVHRLNARGAVVTQLTSGTSHQGFDVEWQDIIILTVDGNRLNRCEVFDEADLDRAIAKFDELSRPTARLENAASRAEERALACFMARDWAAMANLLAADLSLDDRRRVVNAGKRYGRNAAIADARAVADLGGTQITSDVIALRGEHLFLARSHLSSRDQGPDAFHTESLCVAAMDADGRIAVRVVFDPDDLDGALAELDARYVAGEGATHSQTWFLVTQAYAAFNRHEFPPGTMDFVGLDHRRGIASASDDMAQYVRAVWELAPDAKAYVETTHRLTNRGAVVVAPAHGTTQEGFDAEWREVHLLVFDGDLLSRFEVFDEDDLDTAVARFDELSASALRLENAATRLRARVSDAYNRRDVEGFLSLAGGLYEDRRKGLRDAGAGSRDFALAVMSETPTSWRLEIEPVAVRGNRLALSREAFRDSGDANRPITVELMVLTEVVGELLSYTAFFDPDDVDAALAELDARFVAGDGAAYSHVWTRVNETYARFNLHQLSPTTPDWVNVDHRRGAAPEPGDMHAYVSAMWAVAPDVRTCIESVHRLTNLGAVFTHSELGTSQQGFGAEWHEVTLLTFDGNLIDRCELFDEDALHTALAKFDELAAHANHLETIANQLDNAATRVRARLSDEFNRRDMSAFLALAAPDGSFEDRRKGLRDEATGMGLIKVTNALFEVVPTDWIFEVKPLAVRGSRLALTLDRYRTTDKDPTTTAEHLTLTEIDDDGLVRRTTLFDPDDIDAAFEELDARYIRGEATAQAGVWSDVARVCRAFNRREVPAAIPGWVNIDHRRGTAFAPGELTEYLLATWELSPTAALYIEEVHRVNELGAVITLAAHATSRDGFAAEWRVINLFTFDSRRLSRVEVFDESDVGAAVAVFDVLTAPAPQPDNAVTVVLARVVDAFNRRDIDSYLALFDDEGRYDDRRKGLRDNGPIKPDYASAIVLEAGTGWQEEIECIAVRGRHLLLCRAIFRDHSEVDCPIAVEALVLAEVTEGGLISAFVVFDCDDIDAALTELTARWIASGEVQSP